MSRYQTRWLRLGASIPCLGGLLVTLPLMSLAFILGEEIGQSDRAFFRYAMLWTITALCIAQFNIWTGGFNVFAPKAKTVATHWTLSALIIATCPETWGWVLPWGFAL